MRRHILTGAKSEKVRVHEVNFMKLRCHSNTRNALNREGGNQGREHARHLGKMAEGRMSD